MVKIGIILFLKKNIKGTFVENKDLKFFYSNSKIVLNDHWDDMKKFKYINNRIYDVTACFGFIITDNILDNGEIPGLVTFKDSNDLKQKVNYFLNNSEDRINNIKNLNNALSKHTFAHNVEIIKKKIDHIIINENL